MSDFAGASLRIQPVGDDATIAALDKIDRRAQQSSQTWDRLSSDQIQKAADRYDRMYGTASSAMSKIEAAAYAMDARMTASAEKAATASDIATARSTQSATRGLEIIARTGSVTGRSMDNILASVSNMAFSFGSEGLLVGALAIGASAIVDIFTRARKELEKTQLEFNNRLDQMAKSGSLSSLAGKSGITTELYSGDPFAKIIGKNPGESDLAYLVRSQGIVGLQNRVAQLGRQPVSYDAKTGLARANPELTEAQALLDHMTGQWKTAMQVVADVTTTTVSETNAKITTAADKKNLKNLFGNFGPGAYLDSRMSRYSAKNLPIETTPDGSPQTSDAQLRSLEAQYLVEYKAAQTEEKRLEIFNKIKTVLTDIDKLHTGQGHIDVTSGEVEKAAKSAVVIGAQSMSTQMRQTEALITAWAARISDTAQRVSTQIGDSIAGGINAGIEAAFARGATGGSVFATIEAFLLDQLGSMFETIGEGALAGLTFMATIKNALETFLPEIGIPAALGLIAAGAAMKGEAGRLGGAGASRSATPLALSPISGRTYVSPGAPSKTVASASSIQSRQAMVNQFTVIGPNDARAFAAIQQGLDQHAKRS